MTWTYTDESYKSYTRDTWNEAAGQYGAILRNLDRYNPPLFRGAALKVGQHVLDLATGPGEPALTMAQIVGPTGRVVGGDLAENMVKLAAQRAKQSGVTNTEFRVLDAETLDLPDGAFDAVTCRFGLQIFTDPDASIAEAHRVLKPGGRFAASVWASPGERSPSIHVIIEPMLKHAEPDETGYLPTPYEMGGPGDLVALFEAAGLRDVREERHNMEQVYTSVDEYFRTMLDGTPIGHSLREEDKAVQDEVMQAARENIKRYVVGDAVVVPAEAVYVTGVK